MFPVSDAYEELSFYKGFYKGLYISLNAQIKALKKILSDFTSVLDIIRETKDFDVFSDEKIKELYHNA